MALSRSPSCRFPRSFARGSSVVLTVLFLGAYARSSVARPGTHPVVVSTWDARASSVLLQYRRGLLEGGGGFNVVSYEANFSATSGKLSSQFGLHYLSLEETDSATAHGLSATATALFVLPITSRFENGLPRSAISFYVGSAPTALVSGDRNYLSLPLTLGLGVPISPSKLVTLTPWFEFSPGLNLDTVIHSFALNDVDPNDYVTPNGIELSEDDVERVLRDSVELDLSASVGARAGLDLALHVSDRFDVAANATLSSVGTAFSGSRVVYVGGGFVWRWDAVVPAVLPADKRLLNESCDAIEQRFRSCPNSRSWSPPSETPMETPPPSSAPALPVTPAPSPPASSVAPDPSAAPSPSSPNLEPVPVQAPPVEDTTASPTEPAAPSTP